MKKTITTTILFLTILIYGQEPYQTNKRIIDSLKTEFQNPIDSIKLKTSLLLITPSNYVSLGYMDTIYAISSKIAEKQKRYEDLFDLSIQYANLCNMSREYTKAVAMYRIAYESVQKTKNIKDYNLLCFDLIHYKNESIKLEEDLERIKNQKNLIILFSICFVLIILLIIVLLIRNNLKKEKSYTNEIKVFNHLLKEKNNEITDSINYSKRIQTAILPDILEIKSNIENIFITYNPKDIVSGDFYYFNKINSDIIIAAADCTGHGVPGAFMSLIASKELQIANSLTTSPSKILKFLNNGVKETLKQNKIDGTKDGMDIALLKINGNNVIYSGANRPLWLIENNSIAIREIKATKTAIAGHTADNQEFEEHELNLNTGDTLYIFSDGYADQFGGERQKKMTTKRFKDLLLSIQKKTMTEQQLEIESYIRNWQGDLEQVDDVLVIGIRI